MDDIKKDIDKLFDEFESSSLYQKYLSVEKQMLANENITSLLDEIRRLQKIFANTKDKNVELKIESLYDSLKEIPLYQSYLIIMDEINQKLYGVKEIFEKYFSDLLSLK